MEQGFLDTKFSNEKRDLLSFQCKLLQHFQDMGMNTIMYLKDPGDPTKMVNLLMDYTLFTQAYVKTAIKDQHKLYNSYNHSNDRGAHYILLDRNDQGACYILLDSLDTTFKMYVEAHLPDDFCFLLIWMQVIKALQSDSLKHFKTMKHELENIRPQQYAGQNIADMSLDVTNHCQALTTGGVWDHQLCLSILSTFLLAADDEMYHHSVITMKPTLEDELKKVATKNLPMPTFVTLLKLSTKKPRVCVSGRLLLMPRTPRHHLLPSTKLKSMPLFNAFRRVSPLPSHVTRAMTLVIFVERKDIGLMNV